MRRRELLKLAELISVTAREAMEAEPGKTCYKLTLRERIDVKDGTRIPLDDLGDAFFTLDNKGQEMECNFYPNFARMDRIRRINGENLGDKLANIVPLQPGDFPRRPAKPHRYGSSGYWS